MSVCNTSIPWRHFRKSFNFTACETRKRCAVSPVLLQHGSRSVSASARAYSTRDDNNGGGVGADDATRTLERSKFTQPFSHAVQGSGAVAERRPGSTPGEVEGRESLTPEQHASIIAKVRRLLSEKHLVDTPEGMQMCTILASSSQDTTLQSLLDQLPPFHIDHMSGRTLLIFLVTPSFAAQAAADGGSIFSQIMSKSTDGTPHEYETLVAVVDRLPEPSPMPQKGNKRNAIYRSQHPRLEDSGHEGFAFVSTTTHASPLPPQSPSKQPLGPASEPNLSDHNKHASLTLNMHSYSQAHLDTLSRIRSVKSIHRDISSSIQIPLARTVFQTGLPHTLLHSAWSRDPDGFYCRQRTTNLEQFEATLPLIMDFRPHKLSLSLSLPLIALTNAKPVYRCMGNIIRQLSSVWPVNDNGSTFPASTELEKAVSEYFEARSIPSQSVSVWALVIPRGEQEALGADSTAKTFVNLTKEDLQKTWANVSPNWAGNLDTATLFKFMQNGASLRRVMSGGGGWGKKAGLLSLDPDSSYDPQPEDLVSPDATPDFWNARQSSPVGQVADEGDLVQFFIWPYGYDVPSSETSDKMIKLQSSVDFGVIPSSIDSMPGSDSPKEGGKPQNQVFANHFGALSEAGLAIGYTRVNISLEGDGQVQEITHRSKVDVPFARFSHLDVAPVGDSGEGQVPGSVLPSVSHKSRKSDGLVGAKTSRNKPPKFRKARTTLEEAGRNKPLVTRKIQSLPDHLSDTLSVLEQSDAELNEGSAWRHLHGRVEKDRYANIVEAKKQLKSLWLQLKAQREATQQSTAGVSLTSDDPLEKQFASLCLRMAKYYDALRKSEPPPRTRRIQTQGPDVPLRMVQAEARAPKLTYHYASDSPRSGYDELVQRVREIRKFEDTEKTKSPKQVRSRVEDDADDVDVELRDIVLSILK